MPERFLLTGGPEQAAAQLISNLKQRGILPMSSDVLEEMTKTGLIDLVRCKTEEVSDLKRMNEILKGQVDSLLKLVSAVSGPPSGASGRRGRARRGSMGTISEASPP